MLRGARLIDRIGEFDRTDFASGEHRAFSKLSGCVRGCLRVMLIAAL